MDVMAKYCLRRLAYVSRKGPRGKPPTLPEIEAASVRIHLTMRSTTLTSRFQDAAFCRRRRRALGSLDTVSRLQEQRNYPAQQVSIMKYKGISRVSDDGDSAQISVRRYSN